MDQFRILGVSGHRQYRSQRIMRKFAEKCVKIAKGEKYLAISCGGCYYADYKKRQKGGFDYHIMFFAMRYDVPLILRLPFTSFYISEPFRMHALNTSGVITYYRDKCDEPWHYADALLARNQTIVNDAFQMAIFWDGRRKGGTYDTLKKANKKGIPVQNYAASSECPATLHFFINKQKQERSMLGNDNIEFDEEYMSER